ncbi:sensor histidine kinase [Massilia psychrophila]|uniref:histidine kinase n=1 Tax=Massilia psychrophila TaxID=1603353 RepID=A0A2G8SXS9_9BURK|nr:HAMP domain-containing sensor histidine kinase [Massilia psychrophila]PIL38599.1 two-component sensor histidine kinase [Massilia psychrophila]GGE69653.1 two-component sensor histidine kinase [Massilia psychrophila]
MKLATFITENMDCILSEWEAFATTLEPAASQMSPLALRDHAKGILTAIVLDIRTRQNAQEQLQKSQGLAPEPEGAASAASIHGGLRHDSNFSLVQLSAEFRALRATVLRLWLPQVSTMSSSTNDEMVRFNESIDQALAESVVTYSARADHTRELFLAVLGHDLRAPLSTLSMAGQLLMSEATPAAQVGPIGLRIERCARLMSIMVDDLIGYTRTQLGAGMPTMLLDTDLRPICEAAVEDALATHPGSDFDVALVGDLVGQYDGVRMHQLMTNLLINAAQYGGRSAPALLRARADADTVIIEVTNQGNTIPADSLQSIFRPLIQLPAEGDARPGTSLGLGLFIAREIALAHGGTIVVSSSEMQGTTFTVRLPRNNSSGKPGPR